MTDSSRCARRDAIRAEYAAEEVEAGEAEAHITRPTITETLADH